MGFVKFGMGAKRTEWRFNSEVSCGEGANRQNALWARGSFVGEYGQRCTAAVRITVWEEGASWCVADRREEPGAGAEVGDGAAAGLRLSIFLLKIRQIGRIRIEGLAIRYFVFQISDTGILNRQILNVDSSNLPNFE